ncbi:hypothetical protein [Bradyrhizobium oligotrophicum]|uniref:hypothetical protein n=1 Tax=Bradyrhizobium oligotrophicum TaxID=44255 RepID=UPI003EBCB24B
MPDTGSENTSRASFPAAAKSLARDDTDNSSPNTEAGCGPVVPRNGDDREAADSLLDVSRLDAPALSSNKVGLGDIGDLRELAPSLLADRISSSAR